MLNLTATNFEFARELFHENVSSRGLYFSLVVFHATLCYICYTRFWNIPPTTATLNTSNHSTQENDPLENCNYANIKVTKLLIHPIKSCRGTSVLEAEYTEEGLEHDRKLAIIDAQSHKVITAREQPGMVLIYPQLVINKQERHGSQIHVSFPEDSGCETFTILLNPTDEILGTWAKLEDVELWGRNDIDGYVCQSIKAEDREAPTRILSQYLSKNVYLVLKGPRRRPCHPTHDFPALKASNSYQDGYPLLVASEESLLAVQTRLRGEVGSQGVADRWSADDLVMERFALMSLGGRLRPNRESRFRPNIVLAGTSVPWAEDMWEIIRIGGNASTITLVSKCTRCLLPNVDPETGERDKAVPYKVLMKFRTGKDPARLSKPCFGCNGVPTGPGAGPGMVRVGDSVTVLKSIQRQN